MKIKLNEVLSTSPHKDYKTWVELTTGDYQSGLNLYKGMPYLSEVVGRIPLINFHINPYKEENSESPWRDLVFQDEGIVIYNGDNKTSDKKAHETFGNKKVLDVLPLYFSKDKSERLKAPPILVTRTVKIGAQTGYREIIGIGLINESPQLVHQYEKKSKAVFSNYQFTVTLISLAPDDFINWKWIDDRRNNELSDESTLAFAPKNWIQWVENGTSSIPKIQLKIKSYKTISEVNQRKLPAQNKQIIDELLNVHYPNPTIDGIRFEAFASFVTTLFFEKFNYERGWITVGTGDRGVDFVGRLDIGHDFLSKTSIIVLGQSKRYKSAISGERLTRVASRMTRGYIGVVITLDVFSVPAQHEIKDDKLPIILINGAKLSELVLTYMNKHALTLKEIVESQDAWAKENLGSSHYDSILSL
jgi:hypothetical protein